MSWFLNALGATIGLGLGILAFVIAAGAAHLLYSALSTLIHRGGKALDRIAAHKEVVIEEFDEFHRRHTVAYLYPTPDRVRLARKGEPGDRPTRDRAQKKAAS